YNPTAQMIFSNVTLTGIFFLMYNQHPASSLFPYTTLFRSPGIRRRRGRRGCRAGGGRVPSASRGRARAPWIRCRSSRGRTSGGRSEEHTSELQSRSDLVCRLLLEKKKPRHSQCSSGEECSP